MMTRITTTELASEIERRATGQDRFVVAIAGPPGSGKSTLADDLAARLGPSAAVMPMDGFHLENDTLTKMGLLHRKGAPETFDASGFVRLISKLRAQGDIAYPTFDRTADRTVPDGGSISAETAIVLVEGNYLLLKTAPWSELADLFDMTVRLDVNRNELQSRLIQRWLDHGLPEDQAQARANDNDMRNVDLVEENSREPDFWLKTSDAM